MSAPLAVELERELGAAPRQFTSVSAVVRWYRAHRERKEGRAMNLEGVGGPRSAAHVAQTAMTYARIIPCLEAEHFADYPEEALAANALDAIARGRVPRETPAEEALRRVKELVLWCEVLDADTGQAYLSERLKFETTEGCSSYMRYTVRVLRRRFVAVGLIVEGD